LGDCGKIGGGERCVELLEPLGNGEGVSVSRRYQRGLGLAISTESNFFRESGSNPLFATAFPLVPCSLGSDVL
jgi:hypothetical protein